MVSGFLAGRTLHVRTKLPRRDKKIRASKRQRFILPPRLGVGLLTTGFSILSTGCLSYDFARERLTQRGQIPLPYARMPGTYPYTVTNAAADGNLENVKRFLQVGKSAEGTPGDIFTPLYEAAKLGYLDIVRYLHEVGGADLTLESQKSGPFSPLIVSTENRHWRVADYILSHVKDPKKELAFQDYDGNTAVHYCAGGGKEVLGERFREPTYGPINRWNWTNLLRADGRDMYSFDSQLLKRMLAFHPNLRILNQDHKTPLDLAYRRSFDSEHYPLKFTAGERRAIRTNLALLEQAVDPSPNR